VRDRPRRRHLVERRQLEELAGEGKQIDVERRLELRQSVRGETVDGLLQPGRVVLAVQHAARRIEQHGNRVLLRPQRLRHERRSPGQHQQGCQQGRLQHTEPDGASHTEPGSTLPEAYTDGQARDDDQCQQQPDRPTAGEDELGAFERGARVLEQQLEQPRLRLAIPLHPRSRAPGRYAMPPDAPRATRSHHHTPTPAASPHAGQNSRHRASRHGATAAV
jgi:hypothetical protein